MELIRGLQNIRPKHHGCVATIGNFDGVHLGHQAVLGQLAEKAAELDLPTVLITFEPQPMEYFVPDKVPARLTRFREKILALQRYSVDRVCCLSFNDKLANLSAQAFIEEILVAKLGVKYLVVGDDFRFGQNREGTFDMLVEAGKKQGFQVVIFNKLMIQGLVSMEKTIIHRSSVIHFILLILQHHEKTGSLFWMFLEILLPENFFTTIMPSAC